MTNAVTAESLALDPGTFLARGGNSGRKIHLGIAGSTVLGCGHWLKAPAERYRVRSALPAVLCERCFGLAPEPIKENA